MEKRVGKTKHAHARNNVQKMRTEEENKITKTWVKRAIN